MELNNNSVYAVLSRVEDPARRKDVVSLGYVTSVRLPDGGIDVRLTLPPPPTPLKKDLREDCRKALAAAFPEAGELNVELGYAASEGGASETAATGDQSPAGAASGARSASAGGGSGRPGTSGEPETPETLKNVKYTIAVASGKGGVGKSTVSVNLAAALAQSGAKVGILDADVYGPSLPIMLNVHEQPVVNEHSHIMPLSAHGMSVMSIGFLAEENQPFIWRGPMASGAIGQFIKEVEWGELDYLIFDLPPGTGDVQLTLVQTLPITGAVIVTTPQNLALADATRARMMFERVNVPILGLIENMSYYICPECGHRDDIFDSGGGKRSAEEVGTPLLGEIPLLAGIRRWGDDGTPFVIAESESEQARNIVSIAQKLRERLPVEG